MGSAALVDNSRVRSLLYRAMELRPYGLSQRQVRRVLGCRSPILARKVAQELVELGYLRYDKRDCRWYAVRELDRALADRRRRG